MTIVDRRGDHSMMSRQEFIARQQVARQEENREAIVTLVLFFGLLLGNAPVVLWIEERWSAGWIRALHVVVCIAFLLAVMLWAMRTSRRRAKKYGMLCPGCRKFLYGMAGQLVIAAGRCGYCGVRVLEE